MSEWFYAGWYCNTNGQDVVSFDGVVRERSATEAYQTVINDAKSKQYQLGDSFGAIGGVRIATFVRV